MNMQEIQKKIKIMLFGTFDGVHAGHRFLFREAKKLGDHLIVVVARDKTIEKVKGKKGKYLECVRWGYLYGEEHIDEVILGGVARKHDVIKNHKPDIIVLGYDQDRFVRGLDKVFSGEMVRLPAYKPERYKSSQIPKKNTILQEARKRLRNHAREKRDAIPETERQAATREIEKRVFADPNMRSAKSIFLYRSVGTEVGTEMCMKHFLNMEKEVYVPILGRSGQFSVCRITQETQWKENRFGILEPIQKKKSRERIDVCLVPCMAVTKEGDRIGMGGGYYDRFLAKNQCRESIALVYDRQILPCIPTARWDRRVDRIISA